MFMGKLIPVDLLQILRLCVLLQSKGLEYRLFTSYVARPKNPPFCRRFFHRPRTFWICEVHMVQSKAIPEKMYYFETVCVLSLQKIK
ncbi:unnamed protein product [Acanthoscelides obtectus]|uniref:Uncharacterized protein n=1 Tax=Acanthoscelides obtectus TaxID=200917 RepID=A0A9P0JG89_ACAOB|nr:unnamed protein product [Acanthoscelides obtectus]CAK1661323.1 hypothetical protein AOBTE_LOCUS22570 [Acanthoscelides obtectus]